MRLPRYQVIFRLSVPKDLEQDAELFVPSDLFLPLPQHSFKGTAKKARPPKLENDWRHGSLQIDWMDFPSSHQMRSNDGQALARSSRLENRNPIASFVQSSTNDFKSGSTILPDGVVHIFRESDKSKAPDSESILEIDDGSAAQGPTLAIIAVPPHMSPSDLLTFVAPAAESIKHLRMIRDSSPNRTLVLIKFRDVQGAAIFAEEYNGRQFVSFQPEICQIVHVTAVKVESHDEVTLANARLSSSQDVMCELPSCPVCLERMDSSVTGLVTVPCMHTFHCSCLTKWGDSRCPVCRYSQLMLTSHRPSSSTVPRSASTLSTSITLSSCWDCSSTTNLWICLVCGNIGCGRYGRAHAQGHYETTSHVYALELETQRVWDYAGDGYVHRLIQNKADGKLVELPSASAMNTSSAGHDPYGKPLGPSASDDLAAEKIEAIGIEYSYLLTSQLDSQREYFEEERKKLQRQLDLALQQVDDLRSEESARLSQIERDKIKLEKRANKAAELARQFEKELSEERAVSKGLLQNMNSTKVKLEKVEKENTIHIAKVVELEEQVRDLMFFLEAKDKIAQGDEGLEDAAGGSLEVKMPPVNKSRRGHKKNK